MAIGFESIQLIWYLFADTIIRIETMENKEENVHNLIISNMQLKHGDYAFCLLVVVAYSLRICFLTKCRNQ